MRLGHQALQLVGQQAFDLAEQAAEALEDRCRVLDQPDHVLDRRPASNLAEAVGDQRVEGIGALGIVDGISAPGLALSLRAEKDTLAVVSNCPQINNPCNGFEPTAVRMTVGAPA